MAKNNNPLILCIGDIMLDSYVYGSIDRISPEAPVPVLCQSEVSSMLGGVGNVAQNIYSLGGDVIIASAIGDDETGQKIESLSKKFFKTFLIKEKTRKSTKKIRFCSKSHHLLRVDVEDKKPLENEEMLLDFCFKQNPDIVILSDYAKGVLSNNICKEIIEHFKKEDCPILVDPKSKDFSKYKGATLIKPNESELRSSIHFKNDLENSCKYLRSYFKNIIVTRGKDGILFFDENSSHNIKSKERSVFDISGAGDTVIATIAVYLAKGKSMLESITIANKAAGIVVEKPGTAFVTQHDLIDSSFKIEYVKNQVSTWKEQGYKVGFTNGCFDLFHAGHLHLINEAKNLCDKLIVGLNSDESVKRLKGKTRPIQNEQSRASFLLHLKLVDAVVIFDEDTPIETIKDLKPQMIFKGKDYIDKDVVGSDFVKNYGGETVLLDLIDGVSTTIIENNIYNARKDTKKI